MTDENPKRTSDIPSIWHFLADRLLFARSFDFEVQLEPKHWHYAVHALNIPRLTLFPFNYVSIEAHILKTSDTVLIFEVKIQTLNGKRHEMLAASCARLDYDPFNNRTRISGKAYPNIFYVIATVLVTPAFLGAILVMFTKSHIEGMIVLTMFIYVWWMLFRIRNKLVYSIKDVFGDVSRGFYEQD